MDMFLNILCIGPIHTFLGWESWAEMSAIFMKQSFKKATKKMAKKHPTLASTQKVQTNIHNWGKTSHVLWPPAPTTKVQPRLHQLPHQVILAKRPQLKTDDIAWMMGVLADVDVSQNSGTPKSSILIGFSIINHPFWGTPIFGNTHV